MEKYSNSIKFASSTSGLTNINQLIDFTSTENFIIQTTTSEPNWTKIEFKTLKSKFPELTKPFIENKLLNPPYSIDKSEKLEELEWKKLTTEQFLKGFSEEDAVYDNI